jgi:hypothetical protein
MDIDHEKLAALFYTELQKTFEIKGRWRDCSDTFQRVWEGAIHEALIRAASQEGDENGAATLLLRRLSTATGERATDFYTLAALVYEELIRKLESGVSFFGLGNPWEARTQKTHEVWAVAMRRALSRAALSGENPGGDGYCLFVPREAADRHVEATGIPSSTESERPHQQPQSKRPWWRFW